jgi:NitT/TauT family transport system substrate-binding protein
MQRSLYIFILITSVVFTFCGRTQKSDVIRTATLKGPGGMAMIKMIDERPGIGGIPSSYIISNEPNQVRDLMFREEVEFAVMPMNTAVMLYNKGLPYILAAVPVWGTLSLFGSDTSIKSWNDLKGKRVSLMGKGMTPDIIFRFLAKENGIDPNVDFQIDYSFPTHIELANAVAAGVSKLGVISEPQLSMVIERNPDVRIIFDLNKEWSRVFGESIPFAQTALLVHEEFAKNNPRLVDTYLLELKNSINWLVSNNDSAADLIVQYGILPDKKIASRSIPNSNIRYTEAFKEMKGISEYIKVFYNFNPLSIGGKLPDEKFFYKAQTD